MNYLKNVAVGFDQLLAAVFGIPADCTISAYCWILHMRGKADWPYKVVDTIFFWDDNHCEESYYSELLDKYQPKESKSK